MSAQVPREVGQGLQAEGGQVLILFAVASLFFLALLVVVGDTSFVWMQKRDLQNTADAAALAGAQELDGTADSEDAAIDAALNWASKNMDADSIDVQVIEDYTKVRVTVQKKAEALFSGSLSFGNPTVAAGAAARIASVNSLAPCVVPLGVQNSYYDAAKADPDTLVELKLAVAGGDSSNTGLLNLTPGNSAKPIAEGACNALEPEVKTKPGGTIGDVNNGLEKRLKAAIGNNCYTEAQVKADWPRCRPAMMSSGDVQPTAVALLPVLDTDIIESGAKTYDLVQLDTSTYLLAYFWIDGSSTYRDPLTNKWQCIDGASNCIIRGKFLFDLPVDLSVFDPALCPPAPDSCLIDYDPDALIKVVLLDE